jgi:hypothetical protein
VDDGDNESKVDGFRRSILRVGGIAGGAAGCFCGFWAVLFVGGWQRLEETWVSFRVLGIVAGIMTVCVLIGVAGGVVACAGVGRLIGWGYGSEILHLFVSIAGGFIGVFIAFICFSVIMSGDFEVAGEFWWLLTNVLF